MTGVELIAAERKRQVEKEGWTPEHDDQHDNEDLALAACYYALPAPLHISDGRGGHVIEPDSLYPGEWSEAWMKRSDDKIRNLIKAGALIAAEIDRLQRRAVADAESSEKVPCHACKGKGGAEYEPGLLSYVCNVCGGTGQTERRAVAAGEETCQK